MAHCDNDTTPTASDDATAAPHLPGGAVHDLPDDLRDSLLTSDVAREAWVDITTLARNEFICWVEDAKKPETRARRIRRTNEELEDGMRRPCCWPGCAHRPRNGRP
ncbi:YdeI/OmpD-associated family protein [Corynebacterium kroppenstedtii]|uniref:YdeI/OmpD-associated family protein n=1 Tax=Corynebacterium sp. PCR 32 TaxID=3351342 RepID=UPI00309C9B11